MIIMILITEWWSAMRYEISRIAIFRGILQTTSNKCQRDNVHVTKSAIS